jgi:membrane protein CcdC involved in cytochrome C biogenesis
MDKQSSKIQRSAFLIKFFMALVMLTLGINIYTTNVIDLGSVAGALGILSMLRGFLCSASLLSMPIKSWLTSDQKISKESYSYFILAFTLIVISGF